jgi:hypothetical protein
MQLTCTTWVVGYWSQGTIGFPKPNHCQGQLKTPQSVTLRVGTVWPHRTCIVTLQYRCAENKTLRTRRAPPTNCEIVANTVHFCSVFIHFLNYKYGFRRSVSIIIVQWFVAREWLILRNKKIVEDGGGRICLTVGMVQNFCGIYSSNTSVASIKILQE